MQENASGGGFDANDRMIEFVLWGSDVVAIYLQHGCINTVWRCACSQSWRNQKGRTARFKDRKDHRDFASQSWEHDDVLGNLLSYEPVKLRTDETEAT